MALKLILTILAVAAFIPKIQCEWHNDMLWSLRHACETAPRLDLYLLHFTLQVRTLQEAEQFVLLRNGAQSPSYSSGRVQIYLNNRWGHICDDFDFGLTEAVVVCHQLGYTSVSSYSRTALDSWVLQLLTSRRAVLITCTYKAHSCLIVIIR